MKDVNFLFSAPVLTPHDPINKILQSKSFQLPPEEKTNSGTYWSSRFWNLDESQHYKGLSEEQQCELLMSHNQAIVSEIYFIEKGAMQMMNRFSMEAASADERAMYSLFAGEEARHFLSLKPFFHGLDNTALRDPFLVLLAEITVRANSVCAMYMLQVILEGWGMSHYQSLMRGTENNALQKVFAQILRDEAAHHGSGLIMTRERSAQLQQSPTQEELIIYLRSMLSFVRMGPLRLMTKLSQNRGGLSVSQIELSLEDLQASAQIQKQLNMFRKLIEVGPLPNMILSQVGDLLAVPSTADIAEGIALQI